MMDFKHTMWVEGEGIETIKMGGWENRNGI